MDNITPHASHLEIRVISMGEREELSCKEEGINYSYNEINGVPFLGFLFPDKISNFFEHLNFPELKQKGATDWLHADKIEILLNFLDEAGKRQLDTKRIVLSKEDSDKIKIACLNMEGSTASQVDASVDFVYENDFSDYEWLQSLK